jgi:hypothetical protein
MATATTIVAQKQAMPSESNVACIAAANHAPSDNITVATWDGLADQRPIVPVDTVSIQKKRAR